MNWLSHIKCIWLSCVRIQSSEAKQQKYADCSHEEANQWSHDNENLSGFNTFWEKTEVKQFVLNIIFDTCKTESNTIFVRKNRFTSVLPILKRCKGLFILFQWLYKAIISIYVKLIKIKLDLWTIFYKK